MGARSSEVFSCCVPDMMSVCWCEKERTGIRGFDDCELLQAFFHMQVATACLHHHNFVLALALSLRQRTFRLRHCRNTHQDAISPSFNHR
jgi:hypothetical protein